MAFVRWDPLRGMVNLQERINRVFDESMAQSRDVEDDALCAWRPAVDIFETEDAIVLKAELPGFSRENVTLEIKDNVLTIKGKRTADSEIKEENYLRKERCFGTFHRAFTLRYAVKPEKISAKFKEGVLEVEIPKPEEEKPQQITVDIE